MLSTAVGASESVAPPLTSPPAAFTVTLEPVDAATELVPVVLTVKTPEYKDIVAKFAVPPRVNVAEPAL